MFTSNLFVPGLKIESACDGIESSLNQNEYDPSMFAEKSYGDFVTKASPFPLKSRHFSLEHFGASETSAESSANTSP